ncbi:MAG: response regulator [Flavobacteriales bacterium]
MTNIAHSTEGHLTALVVDDDADILQLMAGLLERRGYSVRVARTGSQAMAMVGFTPLVVFLDIGLPDLNGYDVCKHLRSSPECANAYIVAVTGRDEPNDLLREANAGFDRHVSKPMATAELDAIFEILRVRAELRQRDPRSAA